MICRLKNVETSSVSLPVDLFIVFYFFIRDQRQNILDNQPNCAVDHVLPSL